MINTGQFQVSITILLFPDRNIGDLKDVVFWLCRGFSEGFDIVSSYSSARSDFFAQMLKAYADRCRNHSATEKHKTTDFNFLITSQKSG